MTPPLLDARALTAVYGSRRVFADVSVAVATGQCVGVLGRHGAGKTTLLRILVGLRAPSSGDVRIGGLAPDDGLRRTPTAYFGGDTTLPGSARATSWGRLGTGDVVLPDRRPIRALARGARQWLGLRTVLGRDPLRLIVLDEPWEGLDDDGRTWLYRTIEMKRDRGAGVVLSSQRVADLAGLCDIYLVLADGRARAVSAVGLSPSGVATADRLTAALGLG